MKIYLEGGPMHGMEAPVETHLVHLVSFERGMFQYQRTGRTFAGLRVFEYMP